MAMARTMPSPTCCAISAVISILTGISNPSLVIRTALKIVGICPSENWTSMAGPVTCITSLFRDCSADVDHREQHEDIRLQEANKEMQAMNMTGMTTFVSAMNVT